MKKSFSAILIMVIMVLAVIALVSCKHKSNENENIPTTIEEEQTDSIQIYEENFKNLSHEDRRERFGEYIGEKLFYKYNYNFGILTYLTAEKAVSVIVDHQWQNVQIVGKVSLPKGEDCLILSAFDGYLQFWSLEIGHDQVPKFFKIERKIFGSDNGITPIGITNIKGTLLFFNENKNCIELAPNNGSRLALDRASLPEYGNTKIIGVISNQYYSEHPYSYKYLISNAEKLFVVWVNDDQKIIIDPIVNKES